MRETQRLQRLLDYISEQKRKNCLVWLALRLETVVLMSCGVCLFEIK